jgi:hypothetical protein
MESETLRSQVGQFGNLRRVGNFKVGNPPGPHHRCSGRPIANRPQDAILPHFGAVYLNQ